MVNIQTKGPAMKSVYIGIDAHKESNVLALAFAGTAAPAMYGKASADLKAFEAVLRRIMKKHELAKEDMAHHMIDRA
jgi:hypothetical protein